MKTKSTKVNEQSGETKLRAGQMVSQNSINTSLEWGEPTETIISCFGFNGTNNLAKEKIRQTNFEFDTTYDNVTW